MNTVLNHLEMEEPILQFEMSKIYYFYEILLGVFFWCFFCSRLGVFQIFFVSFVNTWVYKQWKLGKQHTADEMKYCFLLLSDILGYGTSHSQHIYSPPYDKTLPQNVFSSASDNFLAPCNTETPPKGFPCSRCDRVFASTGARCNHVATVHNKVKFTCVCGKVYAYQQGLIHHRKSCPMCGWNSLCTCRICIKRPGFEIDSLLVQD